MLAEGHEIAGHLLADMLWKTGIVVAIVVLALIAAVIIWRRVR